MNILNQSLITAFFCICLFPFSITLLGSGASASYFFLFIPFFLLIKFGKIKNPGSDINLIIFIFTIFFFLNAFLQIDYWELTIRKIISFLLFFSVFCLVFFDISKNMERSFLIAIVLVSLFFL